MERNSLLIGKVVPPVEAYAIAQNTDFFNTPIALNKAPHNIYIKALLKINSPY